MQPADRKKAPARDRSFATIPTARSLFCHIVNSSRDEPSSPRVEKNAVNHRSTQLRRSFLAQARPGVLAGATGPRVRSRGPISRRPGSAAREMRWHASCSRPSRAPHHRGAGEDHGEPAGDGGQRRGRAQALGGLQHHRAAGRQAHLESRGHRVQTATGASTCSWIRCPSAARSESARTTASGSPGRRARWPGKRRPEPHAHRTDGGAALRRGGAVRAGAGSERRRPRPARSGRRAASRPCPASST